MDNTKNIKDTYTHICMYVCVSVNEVESVLAISQMHTIEIDHIEQIL